MNIERWTILIYANGNNELEPEITKVIEKLKIENIKENFNILVQLARADEELVEKLRGTIDENHKDRWHGVRRYLLNDNGAHEVEVLENVNMADPTTLYNFLLWGIKNYPSDYVMVVLSGHGAGFIGAMTDFTHGKPYLMSLDGLVNVFYNLYKMTNKKIELLLLDSCYMNLIEVWYEFANIPFKPIKYLLVAPDNVKLEGISYVDFIRYLQEKLEIYKESKMVLIDVIKEFNEGSKTEDELIVVSLEKDKFEKLKNCVNSIAKIINESNIDIEKELQNNLKYEKINPFISVMCLSNIINSRVGYSTNEINKMLEVLKRIVIYPNIEELSKNINTGPAIYMPDSLEQFNEFKQAYTNLLFLSHNNWITILDKNREEVVKESKYIKRYDILPRPIILKRKYVLSSILEQCNDMSVKEAIAMVEMLGWD